MVDDSPKAAGRPGSRAGAGDRAVRRSSRLKVAGKLLGLLGLPLLIISLIVSSGVYCGATRADAVVEFEQRWLGIEPPEGRLLGAREAVDPERTSAEPSDGADQVDPVEPADQVDAKDPGASPETPPRPEPEPVPVLEPVPEPEPEPTTRLAVAQATPIGEELGRQFATPRVARVKIMVDPAIVVAHENWFGYVAELFEATRVSYERLFGIELQLQAVVVWDAASGASVDALSSDLAERERDGADLILGLVSRERPSGHAPPRWVEAVNGDHALVFADRQQGDRYYRNMLRALAQLFGAEPTVEPGAQKLGSFMSEVLAPDAAAPVIDPANRGQVIINKPRPFAGVPAAEVEP